MSPSELFTVGHSNHSLERFLDLLSQNEISAIGDVRSSPYSRYCPQFNQASLQPALTQAGIGYVFLGKELGARPNDPACFVNGHISYQRLAMRPEFAEGLTRVRHGATKYRLALMCAEKDPIECHRMILVCRQLRSPDVAIRHILADGTTETHAVSERRLCEVMNLRADLFRSEAETIEQAYDQQSEKIAYVAGEESEASDERDV